MPKASLALGNLRAFVIVIVVAFHAALAYLAWKPLPADFSAPPYWWFSFAVIDSQHWIGFDLFCAWQDLSLMSLMFMLSGLFVAGSLQRKGSRDYSIDRLWRIGLPFAVGVAILGPLFFYPAYLTRTADASLAGFRTEWLALPSWPSGPLWFLWQLLAVNLLAALLYAIYPRVLARFAAFGAWAGNHPIKFAALLVIASALAYVPLALTFSPWSWRAIGPFSLQLSRPAHYMVFFFAGFALGANGLDRGLLSCQGPLARMWWVWLAAAVAGFFIWAGLTSLTFPDWNSAGAPAKFAASAAFPLGCATGGLWLIACFLRFGSAIRWRLADSLSANAYSIYLLHYIFVVWAQYALLGSSLFTGAKFAIVLSAALIMSWAASVAFGRVTISPPLVALNKRASMQALR